MNNQLIEVTPPDILALDDGISVLVLGDAKWLTDLKDFVNKTFIHSPVALYYTDKEFVRTLYIGQYIKTEWLTMP